MKKIVMFGLVAAAACAANAAAFSWMSSANGTDGGGSTLTSASDAANIVLVYLGNGTADWSSAVEVQQGTWSIASSKGVYAAKVGGTYDGSGTGGFANGNIYGVMAKDEAGGLHQITGTSTYTVTGYSGDTWSGSDFVFATSNYVADKASYPAPEPTSGLLLLVGAGMLALRRKQK